MKSTQLVDAKGEKVPFKITNKGIQLELNSNLSGQWLRLKTLSDHAGHQ